MQPLMQQPGQLPTADPSVVGLTSVAAGMPAMQPLMQQPAQLPTTDPSAGGERGRSRSPHRTNMMGADGQLSAAAAPQTSPAMMPGNFAFDAQAGMVQNPPQQVAGMVQNPPQQVFAIPAAPGV
eukprot:gnl/TRDRNA2_/TRDRNA2_80441_c0_seq1.p1 gnl/TRDRNA2_/TRDRNA2_80441_c0~~gnl/TRDRNA2_/TRDRNA2_80441_c0_seq1.p1  ORF type:complete len:131 (-),score=20.42 gnl/TRDRNA2_/TRDRNA2_80441_c0_seq1:35-406(-)